MKIDEEVKNLITIGYEQAKTVLNENTESVERIAQALIEREVLDASDIMLIMEGKDLPAWPAPTPKDDGLQQVIKPDHGRVPAKGGERPATA